MSAKRFVDTNVLVYAHDVDARSKHGIANDVLRDLWGSGSGLVSPQVLQEFYVTVTRNISTPLSKETARAIVSAYSVWCIDIAPGDVSAAFRIEDDAKIGFWDALIVAAAMKGGATTLLSEDLNAGQVISGVRVENPFVR